MKKIKLIILLLLGGWGAFSQPDPPELRQYLRLAADESPELRARHLNYMAALERAGAAAYLPDPEVSFGFLAYPLERMPGMTTMELSVMQMFPWFGTLDIREEAGMARAEQALFRFHEYRLDLFLQVRTLWYQIYLTEKQVRLMREQIALMRAMEGTIEAGIAVGRGTMADWLRLQMEIREMEVDIIDMEEMRRAQVAEFNALLNRPLDAEVAVADTLLPVEQDFDMVALYDTLLVRSPELRAMEAGERAASAGLRLAEVEERPMFGLGVQYMRMVTIDEGHSRQMGMIMPMVTATIPLFRGRYQAMQQEMRFEIEMIQAERLAMERMMEANLFMRITDFQTIQRKISLLRQNVELAGQVQRILINRYTVDRAEFDGLLQVLQQLIEYSIRLEEAVVEQHIAIARIERAAALEFVGQEPVDQ